MANGLSLGLFSLDPAEAARPNTTGTVVRREPYFLTLD